MSFFETLIPPPEAPSDIQYAHRVRITLVACAGFLIALFGGGASLGLIPGFEGFAHKSDLTDFHAEYLDNTIFTLRVVECSAPPGFARQHYSQQIGNLMRSYRRLTNQPYELPSCGDL